jgi:hypothetical protein
MKRFFTLIFALAVLVASGWAQDDKIKTFQFIDEQGNIVPDGSVITINKVNDQLQMVVPLHIKNTTGEKAAVSMWEDISQKPSGEWQTCAFGNCMTLAESGYSAKSVISGEYDQDIMTEWMLEEGQYGSWTATLEIRYFNITKNFFGMEQAGNNVVGYGPSVTINFVYADNADVNNVQRSTPTVQRVYDLQGRRLDVQRSTFNVQRSHGLSIVRLADGRVIKRINP